MPTEAEKIEAEHEAQRQKFRDELAASDRDREAYRKQVAEEDAKHRKDNEKTDAEKRKNEIADRAADRIEELKRAEEARRQQSR